MTRRAKTISGFALAGLGALLVVGWVAGNQSRKQARPARAAAPNESFRAVPAWFEERAAAAGIDFRMGYGGKGPLTVLEVMGAGSAICDFDGDGDADIFLVGQEKVGNPGRCALYHNNGDGTFRDVTAGSGLERPGLYMGCAVGDVDNDGRPDLLVTGYGVNRLYRNLGKGRFADVTARAGLQSPSPTHWHSSAAFADVDNDGLLDVYIGRYVVFNEHSQKFCDYGESGEIKASCGPNFYDPQQGSLYRNLGGFRFQDVTRQTGLDTAHGKCLGVTFADVNGDGWTDLYLGNDEMPGDLFINDRGKRFRDEALRSGVALAGDGDVQGAMGVDFGDFDRNGRMDLVVTTYQFEPTSLYAQSVGNGPSLIFEHRGLAMGIDPPSRPLVGFGAKFVDVNNDGWLDLAVANGHIHDNQEQIDRFSHYRQPMHLFISDGGKAYVERAKEAGPGFTTPGVGRGLSVGDLNNDGRLDLVITDLEGPTRVLINRMRETGNWLRIDLRGTRSNRMGLGSRITVTAGTQQWVAEATTGGSYFSASDCRTHFGLGSVKSVDRIEVRWPSGKRSVVKNPRINADLTLQEPA